MGLPVQLSDGERVISVDHATNTLMVVEYEHHEIHSGSSYRAGVKNDALGNTNTLSIDFKTPANGKQLHLVLHVTTENAAEVIFYEDVEISSNGSAITPRNANRNFGDGSSTQFMFKDSTLVTTNTTILGDRYIGVEGAKSKDPSYGGEASSRHEWVLKEDAWYSVELTSVAGSDQAVWIGLDWYEHTPKRA